MERARGSGASGLESGSPGPSVGPGGAQRRGAQPACDPRYGTRRFSRSVASRASRWKRWRGRLVSGRVRSTGASPTRAFCARHSSTSLRGVCRCRRWRFCEGPRPLLWRSSTLSSTRSSPSRHRTWTCSTVATSRCAGLTGWSVSRTPRTTGTARPCSGSCGLRFARETWMTGWTSSISLRRCSRRWKWTSTTTSTGYRGSPSTG